MLQRIAVSRGPLVGVVALAFAVAALGADAATAAGGDGSRLLVAGQSDATLRLRVDGDGARVERGGTRVALSLPTGGDVDAIAVTRTGWVAAGSVPVESGNRVVGRDLVLWRGDGASATKLPAVPARRGALRTTALPLVRDGELAGVAWLEGEALDRLGVRAATWDGQAWSAPAVVAAPGPGSQLALTGDVLADGSFLLAWSALDGAADAIHWSRGRGPRWTAPAAIARPRPSPDITPALRADGNGALLAWSRYDGNDYRLQLARFDGRRWSAARTVGGKGTLFPRWQQDALLFRDASHGAWVGATVTANDALDLAVAKVAPALPRPALARDGARLTLELP